MCPKSATNEKHNVIHPFTITDFIMLKLHVGNKWYFSCRGIQTTFETYYVHYFSEFKSHRRPKLYNSKYLLLDFLQTVDKYSVNIYCS
jgi:hypothetical protein